jgi:transcriptional regulator with XRE-family HTH domain
MLAMPRRPAPPPALRDLIRARVAELGLSQSELARRCAGAVSRPMLNQYLNGENDLTGAKIDAVLAALWGPKWWQKGLA